MYENVTVVILLQQVTYLHRCLPCIVVMYNLCMHSSYINVNTVQFEYKYDVYYLLIIVNCLK